MKHNDSALIRVVFFGTPVFAAVQLHALLEMPSVKVAAIITQPDRAAGRGQKLTIGPVKELAIARDIPCLQPHSLRKESDLVTHLARETGPWDIGVVAAYGHIIPQAILDLPAHGCINVHASLLPRWRGAAPIHRAIMAGDEESGVCLMKMEAGLDTGPVLMRISTPIARRETTGSLHDRLAALGGEAIKTNLESIIAGKLCAQQQSVQGITYANKIDKAEARIDFNKSAVEIDRLIRALNPSPGAFTNIAGERVKIWNAVPVFPSPRMAEGPLASGHLMAAEEGLVIGCGENSALTVVNLQPAGGRRLSALDYMRGISSALPATVDS